MRIVVLGATALGATVARALIEDGHDVVVVDAERARLDELSDRMDCGFVAGDGTLPSVLREAGGERPDALMAVTDHDEDNILACLVGRSVGFGRVFPQIVNRELFAICEELELEDAIMPHETIAMALLDAIDEHAAVDAERALGADLRIVRVEIAEEKAGPVDRLDLPEGVRPAAILRGDAAHFADEDAETKPGDKLVLIAREEAASRLREIFGEG